MKKIVFMLTLYVHIIVATELDTYRFNSTTGEIETITHRPFYSKKSINERTSDLNKSSIENIKQIEKDNIKRELDKLKELLEK